MTSKEESKLDHELSELQIDVESNIYAIINDNTVTISGEYVPNSRLAVITAKKLREFQRFYQSTRKRNSKLWGIAQKKTHLLAKVNSGSNINICVIPLYCM